MATPYAVRRPHASDRRRTDVDITASGRAEGLARAHPTVGHTRSMRPQVVAHRGASDENAEHTLGAYVKALDVGAQALECDVRLTADAHLVCVHDRDLRRTASRRGLVSTMDLADLDQLDFCLLYTSDAADE